MVNGILSVISLSDILLLLYRNARDFCVLIFYPATLPALLMNSSIFLVTSLGFSMYIFACHLQRVRVWLFKILLQFELLAMARTSEHTLNKSGESGHACLVPNFRGNVFGFSPLWC